MVKTKCSSEKMCGEVSGRNVVLKAYRNGIDCLLRTAEMADAEIFFRKNQRLQTDGDCVSLR